MTKSNEVVLFYPLVSIHLGIQFQNSISFNSMFLTFPSLWSPEFPVVWIWPLLCHSYYVHGSLGAYLDFFPSTCLQLTVSPVPDSCPQSTALFKPLPPLHLLIRVNILYHFFLSFFSSYSLNNFETSFCIFPFLSISTSLPNIPSSIHSPVP